jgi:hypothetical protein
MPSSLTAVPRVTRLSAGASIKSRPAIFARTAFALPLFSCSLQLLTPLRRSSPNVMYQPEVVHSERVFATSRLHGRIVGRTGERDEQPVLQSITARWRKQRDECKARRSSQKNPQRSVSGLRRGHRFRPGSLPRLRLSPIRPHSRQELCPLSD